MRLGILGGGQLSRMLALSGIPLGLNFVFFDPDRTACVRSLGTSVNAPFSDLSAVKVFAEQVDLITYETENIDIESVEYLATLKPVYPGVEPLRIMQDRLLEKKLFESLGVPTTQYFDVQNKADLTALAEQLRYPVFLKKRKSGYDGKGQRFICDANDLMSVDTDWCKACIVEQQVPYDREISIIACRDQAGRFVFYDLCENTHVDGILFRTTNQMSDAMFDQAKIYLSKIMDSLDYVGVCTLELFQLGDQLIANELAPRVHNSGHWTIEGAVTSQFENHLRSIVNWPLGKASSRAPFVMYNLLSKMPDKASLLQFSGLHLHDYVKAPRQGRKLGHLTFSRDEESENANFCVDIEKQIRV